MAVEGYRKLVNRVWTDVLRSLGDATSVRGELQGAVSALQGRGIHASDSIDDSFAVVDTNGQPGITEENRVVGRTDADGRILVPDLRAFDAKHITIDPNDVPVTDRLETASRVSAMVVSACNLQFGQAGPTRGMALCLPAPQFSTIVPPPPRSFVQQDETLGMPVTVVEF